ncbi:MAG: carboxypeptidase-like regulatory domain-containing protein, partial [Bacteroidales bacterium]
MKRFHITLFLFITLTIQTFASTTIRGVVKDRQTKEELIGATVAIKDIHGKGTVTGLDGSFILNGITSNQVTLECAYIGYETELIHAKTGSLVEIYLNQTSIELNSVEIKGNISRNNETGA